MTGKIGKLSKSMYTVKRYSFEAKSAYSSSLSEARMMKRIDGRMNILTTLENLVRITERMRPNSPAIIGRIAAYITYTENN